MNTRSGNKVHTLSSESNATALLADIEVRRSFARRWWLHNSIAYDVLTAIGWILNTLIPFGLATLLFVPEGSRRSLNVALLAGSAAALSLHALVHVLRLKDKGLHHHKLLNKLDIAVVDYRVGKITIIELASRFTDILEADREEPVS
jgi:hypothetical protein